MLDKLNIVLDDGAIAPIHAHDTDAGYDLCTPVIAIIPHHQRATVNTGIRIDIPAGYYGRIESKSGLMKDKGITVSGTIDAGYRGPIKVVMFNHSDQDATFKRGDKIAQIVFLKCETPILEEVDTFQGSTDRGENGFGSTGR